MLGHPRRAGGPCPLSDILPTSCKPSTFLVPVSCPQMLSHPTLLFPRRMSITSQSSQRQSRDTSLGGHLPSPTPQGPQSTVSTPPPSPLQFNPFPEGKGGEQPLGCHSKPFHNNRLLEIITLIKETEEVRCLCGWKSKGCSNPRSPLGGDRGSKCSNTATGLGAYVWLPCLSFLAHNVFIYVLGKFCIQI